MKNSRITLTWKTFIYFVVFAGLIVSSFWILEIYFLEEMYAKSKKDNCYDVALQVENIIKDYDVNSFDLEIVDIKSMIREIALENEMSLWLIQKDTETSLFSIKYGEALNPVYIGNLWTTIKKSNLTENFTESNSQFNFSKIINLSDDSEVLLVLVARLVPVRYIANLWRNQFILISIIIVALTAIFAILVARNISRPISSLNNAAKSLAKGKYDTKFEADGYLEIEELSDTLNYAVSELAKLDSYQKELIANVSHDLRTPLTLIAGYSEMMRDYPSEITKENLQIIIDEANRLTSLVNAILDLSKLQSKTDILDNEEINVTELIENIIKRNNELLTQTDCTVKFEFEEDVYVYSEQSKLETILYNFLSNAINYCGDDKLVIVEQTTENEYVKISFIDHGIGIAKEHINDIWNRYYKIDKNHDRKHEGTGIGLAIVKSVLERYGAEYGVESEEGKGSEFWFKLKMIDKNNKMEKERHEK